MESSIKRINLMIGEYQHRQLQERGVNVSGLVRDLLDDYLSDHKITISVSEQTKALYEQIVANTGSSDDCVEPYLRAALSELLEQKILDMKSLKKKLSHKS